MHGWPGSVREFYEAIPLLTKQASGYDFAFEVVVPSLPGYGFSDVSIYFELIKIAYCIFKTILYLSKFVYCLRTKRTLKKEYFEKYVFTFKCKK